MAVQARVENPPSPTFLHPANFLLSAVFVKIRKAKHKNLVPWPKSLATKIQRHKKPSQHAH